MSNPTDETSTASVPDDSAVTVEGADIEKGDTLEVGQPGTEPVAAADAVVEGDVQAGDVVEVTGAAEDDDTVEPQAEGDDTSIAVPDAIAGADPAAAVIPPDGASTEGSATAEAAQAIAEDAAKASDAGDRDDELDELDETDPPDGHPEPVPTNVGIVQDNVSKPGVEQTHTRSHSEGIVTSEHDSTPAVPTGYDAIDVESAPESQ